MATAHGDLARYRQVLKQARPCWPQIAGIFLVSLLSTPLALLTPLPLQLAVDHVVSSHPLPHFLDAALPAGARSPTALLLLATGLLVAVALLSQVQSFALEVLRTDTAERLVLGFRARLFEHVQRLSLAYHDARGTTDSVYRIQYDAPAIQHIALDGVIPLVAALCTLVSMLVVIVRIDIWLAVVALAVSPVLVLISGLFRTRLKKQASLVKKLESSALGIVQEVLAALRVVKVFGQEEREHERYVRHVGEGSQARRRLARVEGSFGLLVGLTTAAGTAAVLFLGVRRVQSGGLTLGELLLVMGYLAQLYIPLRTLGKSATTLQSSLVAVGRAFAVLEEAADVAERASARPLVRAEGAITFEDVGFSYPDAEPVLHGVSFHVPAGARLGIAGTTGAGKTTLTALLLRLYDVSGGQILLDGVDLREYRRSDLRNQFSVVLQEPVLFSTTVARNIAYGSPDAGMAEIMDAARAANAHEFILRLPRGYETPVGERGSMLSGGERQRIALARAFLKDAPILILDEPTSSVDPGTEAVILEAMERLMRGRTTLLIAHRLGTLERCDLRLRMERGRVVSFEQQDRAGSGTALRGS